MKAQALNAKAKQRKQLRDEAAARGPNVAFSCNGKNLHMHGRLKDFLNGFRDRIAFQVGDHFEQSGWSGASSGPPLSKSNAWSSPAQASICQPASQRASSQPAPTSQPARIRDFL